MPKTLTLFEHEYTTGFNWTDGGLVALEQMNRSVGVPLLRPTVRAGKRELQAAQHVGVVRLGNRTIQILPKIYRPGDASNEERTKEATHNLLHLLAYAAQLPVREHEIAPLLRHGDDWFEILTRLFASHLLEEWQRGAYKNYQAIDSESPTLKGGCDLRFCACHRNATGRVSWFEVVRYRLREGDSGCSPRAY